MAVTIEVDGIRATIKDNKWKCKDKFTKDLLSIFNRNILYGYSPFPDLAVAEKAAKDLKGKVIKITDRPKTVEERIY